MNGDGFTDNVDFITVRQANGSESNAPTWSPTLDFNGDGIIDNNDFIV